MTDAEEWRPIPGFEGRYEVSSLGRVRSLGRVVRYERRSRRGYWYSCERAEPEKILSLTVKRGATENQSQYWQCTLCKDGEEYRVGVHRLVLLAFVGEPPEGHEACHGDGDGLNNHLSNLRWDTHAANHEDAVAHGKLVLPETKMGEAAPWAKLTEKDVIEIRGAPASATNFLLADRYGVAFQTISKIRRGERWGSVA